MTQINFPDIGGPIVVGIDGSADARRSLLLAGQIAHAVGVDLYVVHAIGLIERVGDEVVPSHGRETEIDEQFEQWCAEVREVGLESWKPRLEHGPPVDTVLRVAAEAGAALIVLGRHGSGQQHERLLGSTAHQVAERAACPVLVVPPLDRT